MNDTYELTFCTIVDDVLKCDITTIVVEHDELLDVCIRREQRRIARKYATKSNYVNLDHLTKKEPYESRISNEMLAPFKHIEFFTEKGVNVFADMLRQYRKLRYYDNNPLIKRATLSGEYVDGTTIRLTEEITYEFKSEVKHG